MYNPFRLGFIVVLIVISAAFLSADEDVQRYSRLYIGAGYHQINENSEENISPGTNRINSLTISLNGVREITDSLMIGARSRFVFPRSGRSTIDGDTYEIDSSNYDSIFGIDFSMPFSYYTYVGGANSIDIGVGPHVGRLRFKQTESIPSWYGTETVEVHYSTVTLGISVEIGAHLALNEHAAMRFAFGPYYDFYEFETLWTSFGSDFRDGTTSIAGFSVTAGFGLRMVP